MIFLFANFLCLSGKCQSKFEKNIEASLSHAKLIENGDFKDNTDLQFLKKEIGENKIIWLGENSHSVKDINVIKLRLIKFLHEEMGFDVIVFESGISNCALSNMAKSQLNPFEFLYTSLIGYWRTIENCDLMEYISKNEMQISGMDPNYKARYLPKRGYQYIFSNNKNIADQYYKLDSIGSYYYLDLSKLFHSKDKQFKKENSAELIATKDSLINGYKRLLRNISRDDLNDSIRDGKTLDLLKFTLQNNIIDLNRDITQFEDVESFWLTNSERDSLMAFNLSYLVDSIYTDRKVIVWAHNMHIKNDHINVTKHPKMFNTISYYLPKHLKEKSFTIGIYGDQMKKNCSKNSLFRISRKMGIGSYFLNLNKLNRNDYPDYWTNTKFRTCNDSRIYILGELYDGFIYLSESEESKLLNFDPYKTIK